MPTEHHDWETPFDFIADQYCLICRTLFLVNICFFKELLWKNGPVEVGGLLDINSGWNWNQPIGNHRSKSLQDQWSVIQITFSVTCRQVSYWSFFSCSQKIINYDFQDRIWVYFRGFHYQKYDPGLWKHKGMICDSNYHYPSLMCDLNRHFLRFCSLLIQKCFGYQKVSSQVLMSCSLINSLRSYFPC